MDYLAHTDGERKQFMKEHLTGTAERSGLFAEKFGKRDWGYCCGMLHDVGKYSEAYQKKIKEDPEKRVDHSTAGAQLCMEKGGLYQFMSYCIAGHHAGLPDHGTKYDSGSDSTLMGRRRKKIEDYQAYREEIEIPEVTSKPFNFEVSHNHDFSLSVFIRMLYSCLVDADFLDTEYFMKAGQTERDGGEPMENLLEKLENHITKWLENEHTETVNGRRTEILRHCLECGAKPKGLFRLTVPTGGGKTIASLAFALRHAVEHHMDRVIYVIPYTSIIEQNAEIFRDILGEKNVLENHSNVNYDGAESGSQSEELKAMQLAAENWDKPIVVTTNVQFFESLFSNKSSRCRKLHNIANSVIIFDEAQMLPNDYLKPCIAMIEELISQYGVSAVLCTATQPALKAFFSEERTAVELCPRMEEQFRFFERVIFQNMGTVTEEDLIHRLGQEHQALCIVNTKKRAQALYARLKGEGVYHLSTTMYPNHRRRVLAQIRKRLKDEKSCIVISTSLVEAGVDLDFQSVYRQLAGVDSMIQAAGRCNRNGDRKREDSVVSIFQLEGQEHVPGQRQQMDVTKNLIAEGWDVSALESIEEYFQRLYHIRGESLDKKKIMDAFADKRYRFAEVGKAFKLIEEDTKTILIPLEDDSRELLSQMKNQGYTKSGMRKAAQYCVQVYEREWKKLHDAGIIERVSGDIDDFYELVNQEQYTEDMGLNLEVESGVAVFLG